MHAPVAGFQRLEDTTMPLESGRMKLMAAGRAEGGPAATVPMICSERERLLRLYHEAVAAYAETVGCLKSAERQEFPKRFALADAAREKCDRLREKMDEHRADHGC